MASNNRTWVPYLISGVEVLRGMRVVLNIDGVYQFERIGKEVVRMKQGQV
jgi:hypothetical protein